MASETSGSAELSAAEAAFVEFLAHQDDGEPVDFEKFAAARPEHQGELRRLHHEWLEIARVLGRAREETPSAKDHDGGREELRLDSDGETLKLEFAGEIVKRLVRDRTTVDRYETRGEVARGGMGVIYRVWDPHLRRQLAMKVILARREKTTPEERSRAMHRALARFLEEAQITSQLDHPGVVPVHDLGIDSHGRLYFTMRLVRGRDLRKVFELVRTRREGWTLARALGAMLKVCEAVAYAHSKGVVHRDLKPANVMVGRFGEVYVMDWGLARVLGEKDRHDLRIASSAGSSDVSRVDTDVRRYAGQTPGSPLLTMDGRVVGTPSYMAPEQAMGRSDELGPRADVYAIGAMLYHLLAGHMPYVPTGADVSPVNVYSMLLAGPPAPLAQVAPDAPAELVAICQKAMAREPDDRYAGTLDVAKDVEAFLDRRPVVAHDPSLGHLVRLFVERNQALSATAVVALLVLIAGGALWWKRDAEQRAQNQRLFDLRSATALASDTAVDRLFPADEAHVAEMDRWLAAVDDLQSRAAAYAGQTQTVADLARLAQLRPVVASWRERAHEVRQRSIDDADAKSRWSEVAADLSGDGAARYHLTKPVVPQLGLVPLRRSPATNFWEFWCVQTGARPEIDDHEVSGYRVAPGMGVVLVLLPGDVYTMGSPESEAPKKQRFERQRRVKVDPFFVAKFEVTQDQWNRALAESPPPSLYGPGSPQARSGFPDDDPRGDARIHPVESVSWVECARFLHRCALRFPTEAEWEYACRGGTTTPFWWQAESGRASPEGFENVADVRSESVTGRRYADLDFNDRFCAHATVGCFPANPFGLHDMAGNVAEWCEDWFKSDTPPDEHGDRRRTFRGGSWMSESDLLRSANRNWDVPEGRNPARGLRVARSLD
jgi:formylglycine-generating enzyme required for sulfatase activity/serine/threonine protein kinase